MSDIFDETFDGIFKALLLSYTKEAVANGWRKYPYFYTSIKILEISGWDVEVVPGSDGKDSFRDLPLRYTEEDGFGVNHTDSSASKMDEEFRKIHLDFYTDDDGVTRVRGEWREPDGE